jgi:F-type H+-transporting ATPase subunit delta
VAGDVINGYAEALLLVAGAEGGSRQLEMELAQVARAIETSAELRTALSDPSYPAGARQQIVDEVLDGRSSPVTPAMVSLVVGAGRAAHLQRIADRVVELGAQARGRAVAEVRSAIPLTAEQEDQLTAALSAATGKEIEIKAIVDPSVLGGVVAQIGDQVFDGSVRARLGQLHEAF